MSPLYTQDGKILLDHGKLASAQQCCCSGCPVPCDENNPCPDPYNDGRVQCINNCCTTVACCCLRGIPRPDIASEEICLALGGTFYPGQACGTFLCPSAGVCSCDIFIDRLRIMVANCNTGVMDDRTAESVSSLIINYSNHDMISKACGVPSCNGRNFDYHYQCQIFGGPDGVSWCGEDCDCDIDVPPLFRPVLNNGPGCTVPGTQFGDGFLQGSDLTAFGGFYTLVWKPGYPAAFNGAPWAVWRDFGAVGALTRPDCSPEWNCNCAGNCDEGNPCIEPCVCDNTLCIDSRNPLP